MEAIRSGWAPSTLRGYSRAVNLFLAFCNDENIHPKHRFPADEIVLCTFAASGAGRLTGATARNLMAGLRAWHIAWNADWKGGKRLQYVLNGVEKLRPNSSRRSLRLPVTRDMVRALHRNLDLQAPLDVAIFAAACTLFWGQCRAGELLPISTTTAGLAGKPRRLDFRPPWNIDASYEIILPSTKTHFTSGEKVLLLHQKGSTDPIHALKYHFHVNCLKAADPLFAYVTSCGSRTLTKTVFLHRCNEVWTRLGYPRLTGHCFRIGGTTELLLAGVAPHVVKQAGRWSSDAFLRYWRSVENILPQHMQRVVPARRHQAK
jgi:hypothetical protein